MRQGSESAGGESAGGDAAELSLLRGGGHFSSLFRWYRPNLRGSYPLLIATLLATAIVLACQAVIPLQVHALLTAGIKDVPGIGLLIGLVLLQLVAAYLSHLGSSDVANDSSYRLRIRVFHQLLTTRVLRQDGLVRSSVVSRHTSDVDHVGEAFAQTVGQGIPGVIRVAQSLILLTLIEWRAGLVMTAAVITFLIVRRLVGTQLLLIDRARLDASSRVGESVDEAITASRLIAGLHLEDWAQVRFQTRSERLRAATHDQVHKVTQLFTGAQAAGLAGLVSVVVFGLFLGGSGLASVAAALLYVEGVVRGLEALPGWIRSLQLAVVSRRRIDQVLNAPVEGVDPPSILSSLGSRPLTSDSVQAPAGTLVGVVTTPGLDPDAVLTAVSAGPDPNNWRVTLEGHDIRRPGVGSNALHITADTVAFNDSISTHLLAANDSLTRQEIDSLLRDVGLDAVLGPTVDVDRPLGPAGAALTANQRQRLALALGLAAQPDLLLVGPLIALADADTALPLLASIRDRSIGVSVIAVRSPEMARAMDQMLFVSEDDIAFGPHEELLMMSPAYARLWEKRLSSGDVDLSILGFGHDSMETLQSRLVTEKYLPGEAIYLEGQAADRVIFIISGHVEMNTVSASGQRRRVAVLGPGNHCGDLRLTIGEERAESAYAMDVCIVRSLSREAVAAGLTGLLDRSATERRVVSSLLRNGPTTATGLRERLPDVTDRDFDSAVHSLLSDGALRSHNGELSPVLQKSTKPRSRALLDRLEGL